MKNGSGTKTSTTGWTRALHGVLLLAMIGAIVIQAPIAATADPSATGATITSDLPDYPPGATVTLTGAGWLAGESVHIVVNDTIGQTWKRDVTVAADAGGAFTDAFSLPNYFVSDYDVTATGPDSGSASTTFTDADATASKDYAHWADAGGAQWNNNILNDNKSNYFEGEVIPHVFIYTASNQQPLTNGASYSFNVTYNWYQQNTDAGGFVYMTTYNLSRQPSDFNWTNPAFTPTADGGSFTNGGGMHPGADFYAVDADITAVSAATYTGTGTKDGHVTITFTYTGTTTSNGLAAIYYGLYVAKPGDVPDQGLGKTNGANAWSGGSLQTTVDIGGSGAESIQLAPSAVIPGEISGLKFSDLNGSGTKDTNEPGLAGWTICLDGDSDATNGNLGCVQTANGTTDDLNGDGVVDPVGFYFFSVTPGTYYVYEVNQNGWTQTAPSTVYYGPLVVNATTSQYLNQNFGNNRDSGYLKIMKHLTGGPGAPAYNADYSIHYVCGSAFGDITLKAGATSTAIGPFDTGTVCTVTENTPLPTPPTDYTFGAVSYSDSSGTANDGIVTIVKGLPAAAVEVTVNNLLTSTAGDNKLTLSKSLTGGPGPNAYDGDYQINYDCTGTSFDSFVTVKAGGSQTVSGFPAGTVCTISETLPTPPAGYSFGDPTFTENSGTADDGIVTIVGSQTVTVTTNNTLTRNTGSFKITKHTDNPDGATLPAAFTGTYNCGVGYTGNFSVANGGSQTVSGIPTGNTCSVVETAPANITGYTWGSITYTPATIVISDTTTTFEIVVGNSITRDLGTLTIAKNVINPDGATLPAAFTGTYNCGTGYTGNWSVAPNSTTTVSGIPTGNSCTVSEDAPDPISGYTWGNPSVVPDSVIITNTTGTFTLTVTNSITRDTGSFKITKHTDNPDGATLPAAFTGTYNCGTGHTGTFSVANGGSQTVNGIPTGNTCSVVETAPANITGYTWGPITYTPATIVISDTTTTFEIVVGNSITRDTGSFKITKHTDNPDGATLPAAFTGTYNCGVGHTGTFSVANGGSQTVNGIPTGNTCSVVETAPANITGYTWGPITYTPATIVISDTTTTFEIVVGNSITRDTGSFKITKHTDNPDGATLPAAFTGTYNCGTGHTGTFSVANGGSQTVNGIPTGNTCSVVETAPANITGYTWGPITYTPATIVISDTTTTFEIVVGNSITRDTGSFKITKHTDNPDGATLPAAFTGTYNCGTGHTGTFSVANGGSQTVNGIPTGNTCSVVETAPANITGYTWGPITYTPATIVISTKGGTFEIVVGNSITRDRGTIVIIKNAQPQEGQFAFTTTPSGYTGFSLTGATTGNPPGNVNSQTLPTGNYTVSETTQLGWLLTGIGGGLPVNPNDPFDTQFYCTLTVVGSGTSIGIGDLNTASAAITLGKNDTVTCTFENTGTGATRTQGFWATHTPLAEIAWFGGTYGTKVVHTFPGVAHTTGIMDQTFCSTKVGYNGTTVGKNIDTLAKLMGGFWSDVSKKTTGNPLKRSALDQARMQLLQQLLAAELNASAFGAIPSGGSTKFAGWEAAYCGTDPAAISKAQGEAASFNSRGDSSTFTPGTSADSKNARAIANRAFWDTLP